MANLLGVLTRNWKLKILAFALAVLLWVVVSADQVIASDIRVPLRVENADEDYRLLPSSVPDEVEVRFVGRRGELWDIMLRRPPLRLTVRDIDDTLEVRTLEPRMVVLPNQLSVSAEDVQPRTVRLRFLPLRAQRLRVVPRIVEGPGPEYTLLDSVVVEPATVTVQGPADRVRELSAVTTEPFAIPAGDTLFSRVVPLDTSRLAGLELSRRRVQVTGRLDRVLSRSLGNVAISVGSGVRVEPDTVAVTVEGPASRIRDLRADDVRVVISIDSIPSRIPEAGLTVPLRVERLPPGVEARTQPATVRLLPARAAQPDTLELLGDTVPRGVPAVQDGVQDGVEDGVRDAAPERPTP